MNFSIVSGDRIRLFASSWIAIERYSRHNSLTGSSAMFFST